MLEIVQIQMVLDKVQVFLERWLDCHLKRIYQNNFWQTAVLNALTQDQRTEIEEGGAKSLEDLDLAMLIAVFLGNFRSLRKSVHIDSELSDMAKHVKKIRNLYAHRNAKTITKPDCKKFKYHIDTLYHFLEGLGADATLLQEIDQLYNTITTGTIRSAVNAPTISYSNGIKISVSAGPPRSETVSEITEKPKMRMSNSASPDAIKKTESVVKHTPDFSTESPKMATIELEHYSLAQVEKSCRMINFARAMYEEIFPTEAKILGRKQRGESPIKGRGHWDYLVVMPFFSCEADRALCSANLAWKCPDSLPYCESGHVVWEFPFCDELPKSEVEQIYPAGYVPLRFDAYIATQPGTEYRPDFNRVNNNLNAVKRDAYWYLGNYFPRSFVETFCIYDYVLSKCLDEVRANKDSLTICDIGMGAGGATYGLIWALRKRLHGNTSFKKIKVYGFDGNENAIKLFEDMKSVLVDEWPIEYEFNTKKLNFSISRLLDRSDVPEKADFVITSKCLQELAGNAVETERIYKTFFSIAKEIVSDNGLISIMEIFSPARIMALNRASSNLGDGRVILTPRPNGVGSVGEECIEMYSTRIRMRVDEHVLFAVAGSTTLAEKFPIWSPAARPEVSSGDSDSEFDETTRERSK